MLINIFTPEMSEFQFWEKGELYELREKNYMNYVVWLKKYRQSVDLIKRVR